MRSHPRPRLFPFSQIAIAIVALAGAHTAVCADRPQHPPMTAEQLAPYLPDGANIETRLDADLTGDGLRDLAVVAANDEVRVLKVMIGYADDTSMGFDPAGEMRTNLSPRTLFAAREIRASRGILMSGWTASVTRTPVPSGSMSLTLPASTPA